LLTEGLPVIACSGSITLLGTERFARAAEAGSSLVHHLAPLAVARILSSYLGVPQSVAFGREILITLVDVGRAILVIGSWARVGPWVVRRFDCSPVPLEGA